MTEDSEVLEAELPALRRYALALTRDPTHAEDLVQDCLERALSRWWMRRRSVSIRPWLFRMMRNIHVSQWRRASRRGTHEAIDDMIDPPAIQAGQEHSAALNRTLAQVNGLPEDQRMPLILVAVEGLTYQEAARVLDIPEGTVMSRISRARARLREIEDGVGQTRLRSVT